MLIIIVQVFIILETHLERLVHYQNTITLHEKFLQSKIDEKVARISSMRSDSQNA